MLEPRLGTWSERERLGQGRAATIIAVSWRRGGATGEWARRQVGGRVQGVSRQPNASNGDWSGQRVRWRLAERNVELELGSVVIHDGIEVGVTGPGEKPQAIDRFDRRRDRVLDADQILPKPLRTAADGPFRRTDLSEPNVRLRVGLGNLASNLIEHRDLLVPRESDLGSPEVVQRCVSDAQVLERPVGHGVEVGSAAEAAEDGADEVAAASEPAGAVADQNGR